MLHEDSVAAPPPSAEALSRLLDVHAPLEPVPLCPEVMAFTAISLVGVWEAAEALAGRVLPAPFWAWPWAAGIALARTILDTPEIVRGRRVFDFGAGGGVSSLACALAGAASVVANDVDPWAITVARLAAERQNLSLETMLADITREPHLLLGHDVILCGDLAYDRSTAGAERNALSNALSNGAHVLVADAGRAYFRPGSARLIATYQVPVPIDLEGDRMRVARVYELERATD